MTIRLHRESSKQSDRKISSFTKPRKIKKYTNQGKKAHKKALQLSWLFLRAFFPFNLFMFYLFLARITKGKQMK